MANLVNDNFESDYKSVERMHGGAIYAVTDGTYVINRNYKAMHITEMDNATVVPFIKKSQSIYDAFIEEPDKFDFLNKPSMLKGLI